MTFEDSVQIIYDLSNKLANIVELKGDLVMVAKGSTPAKDLQTKIDDLAQDVKFLLEELDRSGKAKLFEELDLNEN